LTQTSSEHTTLTSDSGVDDFSVSHHENVKFIMKTHSTYIKIAEFIKYVDGRASNEL
jgi:hypothetical protein